MGLFDKFTREFIDIIEWLDPTGQTMVWRFERSDNEIKMGAKLIVRESQTAVFIDQGQLADQFEPGLYELQTQNMPILSKLRGWKYGFESPFKAEVYFVNTRRFTDLKWGTKNPIMLRDPEFGPVRLRAFGTYCVRVADAARFLREIVGTGGQFTTDQISDQLRNLIVSRTADLLGESNIPVLDLAANYDELGKFITDRIHADFEAYGLDVSSLMVENISLPEAVEQALDKRTSMGVIGNLQQYTQFQAAQAMEKAAENPGMAGGGMSMGMGFAMANQMGQAMQGPGAGAQGVGTAGAQGMGNVSSAGTPGAGAPVGPPPLPGAAPVFVALDGQQAGPFDAAQLSALVAQGRLTAQTLVWRQGMAAWTPAGELADLSPLFAPDLSPLFAPDLSPLFAPAPPPLPPQG